MIRRPGPTFGVRLAAARLVLGWERLWPRLLPLIGIIGLFLTLALFNLFTLLPAWLHIGLLGLFVLAGASAAAFVVTGIGPVGRAAARRRLELDSGLAHRPLAALEDELAGGADDRRASALWQAHRARAARATKHLHLAPPRPMLARIDRYGLRAILILALVIAAVAARHDPGARLQAALTPHWTGTGARELAVDAWITPPDYTGRPPIHLDAARTETPVIVPQGSIALFRITGADAEPTLRLGGMESALAPLGENAYRIETPIESGDRLAVALDNDERFAWPISVVADRPPEIGFAEAPTGDRHGQLRLHYRADDDYGVTGIEVRITLDRTAIAEGTLVADEPDIQLSLPVPHAKSGRASHDLTAHMWAGLPVRARLRATDAAGHETLSAEQSFVLPQRTFSHPVARAIVTERRQLIDGSHTIRAAVAAGLAAIANRPAAFGGDSVVFLALSVAHSRLMRDRAETAVPAVRRLLWDAALRLEDGGLSIAERELSQLREQLSDALRKSGDSEAVARLMDEVRRSLDRYLSALMNEAQRRGLMREPLTGETAEMSRDILQRMLDEIRQLAELGNLEAARQKLAELQQALENLRRMVERDKPSAEQAAKAKAMLDALRDLERRQQELLDRSFGRGAPATPKERERASREAMRDAPEQEGLRRRLGELMLDLDAMLGTIPPPVGEAERAMRGAVGGLLLGDNPGAAESQGRAVDALRRATRDAAQRAARGMGGFVNAPAMPGQRPGSDPFGRPQSGPGGRATDTREIEIPNGARLRRAQEILRELRRRAGQAERPTMERDYIDRLLDRFGPGLR